MHCGMKCVTKCKPITMLLQPEEKAKTALLSFHFTVISSYYSVKAGVGHFKSGRHVEAMNEYNKALEIDTNYVEALVARGAL